jgi:methylated-DNA-[protein]-cysteine S-methyltransferase
MITPFQQKVYELTCKVPKGRVTTYKAIADAMGMRGHAARAVGQALNKNPFIDVPAHRVVASNGTLGGWDQTVPCHRVVSSTGKIGGFAKGCNDKIARLQKEDVRITENKIVDFEHVVVTQL